MKFIRDWWRGWSEADLVSVLDKIKHHPHVPGGYIVVSCREIKALSTYNALQTLRDAELFTSYPPSNVENGYIVSKPVENGYIVSKPWMQV